MVVPPADSTDDSGPAPGLRAAVDRGLRALGNLHAPGDEILSGDLEATLRMAALAWEQRRASAERSEDVGKLVAMLRVVCAHLGARDLVEARVVLGAVNDALSRLDRDTSQTDPAAVRAVRAARKASTAQRRALRRRATVEQAVGVVVAHSGASPRDALTGLRTVAAQRGLALLDLADDVVAGRVDASAILGSPRADRRTSRGRAR